jgi:hypothetical protein
MAADRALAAVIHRYAIPRAVPEALLEGFTIAENFKHETMGSKREA